MVTDLLALEEGEIYEFIVFQAERNTNASTYGLSLADFELAKSSCKSMCGDGVVTPDEACDDGNYKNGDGCNAACQVEIVK